MYRVYNNILRIIEKSQFIRDYTISQWEIPIMYPSLWNTIMPGLSRLTRTYVIRKANLIRSSYFNWFYIPKRVFVVWGYKHNIEAFKQIYTYINRSVERQQTRSYRIKIHPLKKTRGDSINEINSVVNQIIAQGHRVSTITKKEKELLENSIMEGTKLIYKGGIREFKNALYKKDITHTIIWRQMKN